MKNKSSIIKLYEIFTPRERIHAGILFLASLLTAFVQAFGVATIFPFINVLMNPESIHQNRWLHLFYTIGGFKEFNSFVFSLGVAVFVVIVFSSLVSTITVWAKTRFVLGRNHTLSRRLLSVYLAKPYEFFLQKNTNELGKNILSEVNQLTSQLLLAIFEILIHGLMVLVMLGMLFLIDASVTMGAIVLFGGSYGAMNFFIKQRLQKSGQERLKANQERFRMANEALSSIKITKVMGVEDFFLNNYSIHSKKFAQHNIFSQVVGEIPRYILEAIAFGGIVFFIVITIQRGESIESFIPLLSLYAFAAYRTMPAIHRFYNAMTKVHYNKAILDKIYEDMIEKADPQKRVSSKAIGKKMNFNQAIKLQDLRFCYSDGSANVINGISLVIPKNSFIGFAGSTGGGKTTLVDIILGLLIPQSGQMVVDDLLIATENIKGWQQKIGYVPQEIYLSDDSIRKNIAFGIPEEKIDDGQVKKVAKIAALDEFVEKQLPQKYNTVIGERGIRLSGGQRQRIGLARALYRDPEILVLDEATSSLDGVTEEAVLQAIHSALESRTVIMIAHRLNTLKDCDQIYILEKGKIVGKGKYEDLIQHNQRFMKMAKISK